MSQDLSTVARRRVLTGNGAVEFLETRADRVLGAEHAELAGTGPQYDPIRDKFMSPQDIQKIDYFEASTTKMRQLETSLSNLITTIKDRKYDKKLSIVLKDPKAYSMTEVLEIASRIQQDHRNADKINNAMGLIRRCFRSVGENQGYLKQFLSFVPVDIYGSVISGGFTILLGAAERAERICNSLYEALADIPLKLKEIQDLGEVYYYSAELQAAADSVLVAIFSILDCSVNELTKNIGRKGIGHLFKGDDYASEVAQAIQNLEKAMADFGRHATRCMHKRFGRVDEKVTRAMLASENTEQTMTGMNATVEDLNDRVAQFAKQHENDVKGMQARLAGIEAGGQALLQSMDSQQLDRIKNERFQTNMYNFFYTFLAASPYFDPQTGSVRHDLRMQRQREIAFPSDSKDSNPHQSKENKKTLKTWLRHLKPAHYPVAKYMDEYLQSFATLSLEEKDQIQWIMTSNEIRDWLRSTQSAILVMESQTHPDGLHNAITFSAALLRKLLKRFDYPVLCAFCGLRANDSTSEHVSGPGPMVASLLAQLLIQIDDKRPDAIVTGIDTPPEDLTSPQNLVQKMQYLVKLLPERDTVFIILDCVEYLSGPDAMKDLATKLILELTEITKVTVKILVTGIVSRAVLVQFEYLMLFVPDFVDGGSQGIHHEFYEGHSLQAILDFDAQQKEETTLEEIETEEDFADLDGWV